MTLSHICGYCFCQSLNKARFAPSKSFLPSPPSLLPSKQSDQVSFGPYESEIRQLLFRHDPSRLHLVDSMIREYRWKGGAKRLLKVLRAFPPSLPPSFPPSMRLLLTPPPLTLPSLPPSIPPSPSPRTSATNTPTKRPSLK